MVRLEVGRCKAETDSLVGGVVGRRIGGAGCVRGGLVAGAPLGQAARPHSWCCPSLRPFMGRRSHGEWGPRKPFSPEAHLVVSGLEGFSSSDIMHF